ncbi:MAG: hypothetical protein B6U87_01405 [Candidatus Aenigmarchaeota archaeon ex4484_52]|nr:MAG: hypothetical protein B6U87_01405 [Candidatus Aenigmarchaeota archaeon ex4484_52]
MAIKKNKKKEDTKKIKKKEIKKQISFSKCPIKKIEGFYLSAGLVIGILIMFAYSQMNVNNIENTNSNIITPQNAGDIVLDIIKMDPNLEMLNVSVSVVNVTEENGIYSVAVEFSYDEKQEIFNSYITKDGKILFPRGLNIEEYKEKLNQQILAQKNQKTGLDDKNTENNTINQEKNVVEGNFIETQDGVCKEDDKPIVYFFGSNKCGFCRWEHPIIDAVAKEFKDKILFKNYMDNYGEDREVFSKYSQGGVPVIVLGCKYYRLGAGTNFGEEKEKENLRKVICRLTNNQPEDICANL